MPEHKCVPCGKTYPTDGRWKAHLDNVHGGEEPTGAKSKAAEEARAKALPPELAAMQQEYITRRLRLVALIGKKQDELKRVEAGIRALGGLGERKE